ncbi:hypothetical protein AB0383_44995 [Amycolatopsis sp. NPDC051373]|uniref:hypothetical protein n=1 Tax=Amycolatopsis sp. NPDC051373 TaxID=3155801 RepID=UPI00344C1E58
MVGKAALRGRSELTVEEGADYLRQGRRERGELVRQFGAERTHSADLLAAWPRAAVIDVVAPRARLSRGVGSILEPIIMIALFPDILLGRWVHPGGRDGRAGADLREVAR